MAAFPIQAGQRKNQREKKKKKNQQIFYTELKLIQSGLKTNKQKTRMLFFFPDVMLQTLFESFNLPPRENHQEYIKYTFVL